MGYLADVAKQIKKGQDIIFVGTGIILVDHRQRVFMACRSDNNQWSLPGGSLEVGESLEECVVRETYEETGIRVDTEDLKFNYVKAITTPINKDGKPIYVVSVTYWTDKYNDGEFKLDSREHTKYSWLYLHEISSLSRITEYSKVALDKYIETVERR